jgi:hypothetical protein
VLRTVVGAVAGLVVGVLLAAGLLRTAWVVVRWQTAPKVFLMEHWVIYLGVLLGAGFGAVCGALAGLAGAVARALRPPPAPTVPPPTPTPAVVPPPTPPH